MITVFLDESGTHATSQGILVGAVVSPDAAVLEQEVIAAYGDVLADGVYWHESDKRTEFATRGFHHADDNDTIRQAFVQAFRSMDFRAHVAFSRRASAVDDVTLMVNMYYTLVRNIVLRYRTSEILFVFEEESRMDGLYAAIVEVACDDLSNVAGVELHVHTQIGTKAAPALALVDYVLALSSMALFASPRPFEQSRINHGLDVHLAHLIDFDRRLHQSARKGIELL